MLGCVTDLTSYDFAVFSNHHVSFGCRFSSFIVFNLKKTEALVRMATYVADHESLLTQ